MSTKSTLLQRREIEAEIVGPIYRAFAAEIGAERAREIIAGVVRELAKSAGAKAAREASGCGLVELKKVVSGWNQGGALSLTVLHEAEDQFDFDVTRCQYAEMYRRLGLEELGPILSCDRDAAMIDGFNPEIHFERTQTLMQGATHCDFRYRHGGRV